MFGLKDADISTIQSVLQQFPEVQSALIFGSRAKGNYRRGSDVDIAVKGEALSYRIILSITAELNEETLLPYHFDVLNYHTIDNQNLVDHIDRVGKIFYEQMPEPTAHEPKGDYGKAED